MDGDSTIHSYNYNLTISRLHTVECLSSVIPGVYRISVYDYKFESIVYTLRQAYQTIATINNAETSTDIVQPTSLIQTSTSCLPTTTSCSTADQSQPQTTSGDSVGVSFPITVSQSQSVNDDSGSTGRHKNEHVIIGSIVSILFLFIVAGCCILVLVFIKKRKPRFCSIATSSANTDTVPFVAIDYILNDDNSTSVSGFSIDLNPSYTSTVRIGVNNNDGEGILVLTNVCYERIHRQQLRSPNYEEVLL